MIKNFKWLFLVSLTFIACNNDDETVVNNTSDGLPLTSGSANFSKYVALGDSFAAGFISQFCIHGDLTRSLMAGAEIAAQCVAIIGARPRVGTKN